MRHVNRCKVRAARGYFAPGSASGRGISGSSRSSPVVANGPSGGLKGHSYAQCPDRFSKAKGQSKSKGYVSKGAYEKGKGFSKSVQFHALSCLAFPGAFLAEAAQGSRVILDTCSRRGIVAAPGRDQCSLGIDPVFFFEHGRHLTSIQRCGHSQRFLGILFLSMFWVMMHA